MQYKTILVALCEGSQRGVRSTPQKQKFKKKNSPDVEGGQVFSNINHLNSKAKTLFATKDFDSLAHI